MAPVLHIGSISSYRAHVLNQSEVQRYRKRGAATQLEHVQPREPMRELGRGQIREGETLRGGGVAYDEVGGLIALVNTPSSLAVVRHTNPTVTLLTSTSPTPSGTTSYRGRELHLPALPIA